MKQEDGRPQCLQTGGAALRHGRRRRTLPLAAAVEEGGEGVDGQGVAALIRHPRQEPEPWRGTPPPQRPGDEEEELEEEAAEDEDAQLPRLPPLLCLSETHLWLRAASPHRPYPIHSQVDHHGVYLIIRIMHGLSSG